MWEAAVFKRTAFVKDWRAMLRAKRVRVDMVIEREWNRVIIHTKQEA